MWRRSWVLARRVLAVAGVCFLVAFAPSTAWADAGPVSLGLEPSVSDVAASVSEQAPAQPAVAAYLTGAGTEADPTIVAFSSDYAAAVLLALGLLVFIGAALLISTWGI
jgi:hypothetical protein